MGELQRVKGVLLDQEHGQAVALVERRRWPRRSAARPAARGRARARRAEAVAAGSSARARSPASAARRPTACRRAAARAPCRRGKQREARGRGLRSKSAESLIDGAHLQVLEHRHARKDAPAFRRLGDATAARSRASAAAVMSLPSKMIAPVAGARIAEDRHHRGRLAGAVGADQRDDLARVDVDVDALERLDLAVEGLDAAQLRGAARRPRSLRSLLELLLDRFDLFLVGDAEIGGDHLRVGAHLRPACRRRSSRRSRARRRDRKSASRPTCRARSAAPRSCGRRGSSAAAR